MPIPLGFWATAGASAAVSSYELISTQFGNDSVSEITFSSIPSTYQHLQLRAVTRVIAGGSGTQANGLRINGDSSSTYYKDYMRGIPNTIQGGAGSSTGYIDLFENPDNLGESNTFAAYIIDVVNYSGTATNKTVRTNSGYAEAGTTKYVYLGAGFRINTAAINSITFLSQNGRSFSSASRFSLYGIKGS